MEDVTMQWFNYVTMEYEDFNGNYRDYLPRKAAMLGLYDAYIFDGWDPLEAYIDVLRRVVGETKDNDSA